MGSDEGKRQKRVPAIEGGSSKTYNAISSIILSL